MAKARLASLVRVLGTEKVWVLFGKGTTELA